MYNLLVSCEFKDRHEGAFNISTSRFLEYTSGSISTQLRPLSIEANDCIKSWPCILMQEGRGQEEAYIVQIMDIEVAGAVVKFSVMSIPSEFTILNADIWKIRDDLDIGQFEFNRNHWAIKNRNLFSILADAGFPFNVSVDSSFEHRLLPAPSRSNLIDARNTISKWSHTEIDDLLLEAGVSGLSAGRDIGSRRDRANSIVEFIFNNPTSTTAENSLFSAFIVRAAKSITNETKVDDVSGGKSKGVFPSQTEQERTAIESSDRSPNRVFVVHGQNESARKKIVSFLSEVGLNGIVLHEQPSMGRHLLTKFIKEAELATFAVVLMTDDDVGGLNDSDLAPRARQNVILELGYFLSHLGQQQICALVTPGLETPSDFDGIVYISMDEDGKWETELRRELRAAGMPLIEEPEQ